MLLLWQHLQQLIVRRLTNMTVSPAVSAEFVVRKLSTVVYPYHLQTVSLGSDHRWEGHWRRNWHQYFSTEDCRCFLFTQTLALGLLLMVMMVLVVVETAAEAARRRLLQRVGKFACWIIFCCCCEWPPSDSQTTEWPLNIRQSCHWIGTVPKCKSGGHLATSAGALSLAPGRSLVCVCVHSWSSSSGRRQQISTSDLSIVTGAVAATAASETRSDEFRSPPRLHLQYIVSHSILQPIKA